MKDSLDALKGASKLPVVSEEFATTGQFDSARFKFPDTFTTPPDEIPDYGDVLEPGLLATPQDTSNADGPDVATLDAVSPVVNDGTSTIAKNKFQQQVYIFISSIDL